MIVNVEQNNLIEGTYLKIVEIKDDQSLIINFPSQFYVNNRNCKNWSLGWGTNKPLYDSGVENLREILSIDSVNKIIKLGKLLRGEGWPNKNQAIVFWNKNPSGFKKNKLTPCIDTRLWPKFCGESVHFSNIAYDSTINKWVMLFNESDTNAISIFAAISSDLKIWAPANNGEAILKKSDFKQCSWTKSKEDQREIQTPFVSDMMHYSGKWYLFMYGNNANGFQNIGLATSEKSLLGPYKILTSPVLSIGEAKTCNQQHCFYPKVINYKNEFLMFYNLRNHLGIEKICKGSSTNLINWNSDDKSPVIKGHTGWRSSTNVSEPAFADVHGDSIFLMIAGAKKFKMGLWHHYVTRNMYKDKSGNVNDAQLGAYLSTDGGKTFIAHQDNPIFANNYADPSENDHLGANFKFLKTDSVEYIFYQAKTIPPNAKYNIFVRERKVL